MSRACGLTRSPTAASLQEPSVDCRQVVFPENYGATPMPLHLAFSAWAMRELPLEQQIDIVQRAGYVGICLVSDARLGQLDALHFDAAQRRELRSMLDSAGLALTAIAGHANLLEPDPTVRAANLERIRAGLDLAV